MMMNDKTRNHVWTWSLIGLLGAAGLTLAANGCWLYRHQTQSIRREKQSEIKAIAELKCNQIVAWRNERLADARMSSRGVFRTSLIEWLKTRDAARRTSLRDSEESLRHAYSYESISFAAPDGRILLSSDSRLSVLDASAKRLVAQAVGLHDAVFGDFFRCPICNEVHLDVASPIFDLENRPVAVVILRINPDEFLYPFVQFWPTSSRTAETLLVRKDGDDALFLNRLRHVREPALAKRIALSSTEMACVQAALGKSGAFEGPDYRGVEVLADMRAVPGSAWFLVAKVDADEILAEARYRGRIILLFTALCVLMTGVSAAFVFIYRQKTLYRTLFRAEQQRQAVEEEIRATFYSIGDAVISTDAAGRIARVNPVAENLTGWSEAEALGAPVEQVFHIINEESRAEVESPVARVLREGAIVNLANHTLLLSRDGSQRPIADSGAPIRDGTGNVAGVVLVFRDQTDERRAAEEQALAVQRMESLFLLNRMGDQPLDAIVEKVVEDAIRVTQSEIGYLAVLNEDESVLTMQYWSKSAHASCQIVEKPIVYAVAKTGLWGEAVRQRKPIITNDYAAPNRWKRGTPQGHVPVLRHMNIPVFKGERIVAVAGVGNKRMPYNDRDLRQLQLLMEGWQHIVIRKRAQEDLRDHTAALETANKALEEAKHAAESANQGKSEFLANMSHEIRTPMTSILGYTDLLMDDSLSAADRRNHLMTVRRNGAHLLQLINDILDLSKIEAGKMVMNLGPCHLPSTVAEVASMMRPRAEQRANTLEVRYAGPLPETIHTDGARLRQVIVNLVGNAVKFTENGNIRIAVSFLPQWRPQQPAVSLQVVDTGIGIRQDVLPRLFEPFAQADSSTTRKYGGTGLGLAISRQIVAALGGELTVHSIPGEGSTFTVTIPTGDLAGANLLQSPAEAICDKDLTRWAPSPAALRGAKILLAEDSIDNQELLLVVLGSVGAEVDVVENGKLAIERAATGEFDVVLMDMNMPQMDGYEATRRLRDHGYTRPILALTANAISGDAERCLAAGCDAHLTKPIDRRHLIETVSRYVTSQASQTEAPAANPQPAVPFDRANRIVSQFAHDPSIAEILPGFVARLPSRLDELCKALDEENLEDLQRLAHRLKGAGGSYGYPTLSQMAGSLERAAKARSKDDATASLAGIKKLCASIRAGWTGRSAEASR